MAFKNAIEKNTMMLGTAMIGTTMIVLSIALNSYFFGLSLYDSGLTVTFLSLGAVVVGMLLFLLYFLYVNGYIGIVRCSSLMATLYEFKFRILFLILGMVGLLFAINMVRDLINYEIEVPVDLYGFPKYQQEIDEMQTSYECCGSASFMDYYGMKFDPDLPVATATVPHWGENVTLELPKSCWIRNEECSNDDVTCEKVVSTIGCNYAIINYVFLLTVKALLGLFVFRIFTMTISIIWDIKIRIEDVRGDTKTREIDIAKHMLLQWMIEETKIMEEEMRQRYEPIKKTKKKKKQGKIAVVGSATT